MPSSQYRDKQFRPVYTILNRENRMLGTHNRMFDTHFSDAISSKDRNVQWDNQATRKVTYELSAALAIHLS